MRKRKAKTPPQKRLIVEGKPISQAEFDTILDRMEADAATFEPSEAADAFGRSLAEMRQHRRG